MTDLTDYKRWQEQPNHVKGPVWSNKELQKLCTVDPYIYQLFKQIQKGRSEFDVMLEVLIAQTKAKIEVQKKFENYVKYNSPPCVLKTPTSPAA